MSMAASRPQFSTSFLEELEARIAPAVIINVGAPADGPANTTYQEAPFVQASASTDPGIASLFAGSPDHYVLTLGPGDKIRMFNDATGYGDYLSISAGKVLAFFLNKDAAAENLTPSLLDDGRVEKNDLVGLSLGTGAKLTLFGAGVDGDIVSNFNASTGLISVSSLVPGNTVAGLSISGGVNGRIIAPGNISDVSIGVGVEQITTLADGLYTYDFGGSATSGPGEALLAAYLPESGKAAGNIGKVVVGSVGEIVGGTGGSGAAGGAITNVTVKSDYDGFKILAGAGGTGLRGGAGGAVASVLVVGFDSPAAAVPVEGSIVIIGGQGGGGLDGAGGVGGAISKVFVGYSQLNAKSVSPLPLAYQVSVSGGDGGDGARSGGAGGSLTDVNVYTSVNGNLVKDEIYLAAGDGGSALTGNGRGGIGGNVSKVLAVNLNDNPAFFDNIVITAGDAGTSLGAGSAGGGVTTATILAESVAVSAGAGSDGGTTGGAGGRVGNITLGFSPTDRLEVLRITAGDGGQGALGAGGLGGSVDKVSGLFLDFSADTVPTSSLLMAGAGGPSLQAIGGRGGSLSSISLFEPLADGIDRSTLVPPTHESISFRAGDGGDGFKGGGVGGAVTGLTFFGYNTVPTVHAGSGGSATGQGSGGAGGSLGNIALQAFNLSAARPGDRIVLAQAGNGGAAAGTGTGGAGGAISSATVFASIGSGQFLPVYPVEAHVHVLAGQGGVGVTGGVGAGGSVTKSVASTASGDVQIAAGHAGSAGTAVKAASGGALTNVSASASGSLSLQAGDGRLGGAGGRINGATWFGINPATNQPDVGVSPTGGVDVQAGEGSVGVGTGAKAGAGGALSRLGGLAGDSGLTRIHAGDGNGGAVGVKAAVGGSISNVNLFGGLGLVDLRAGHGGSLAPGSAGAGAAGGNVSGVNGFSGVNFLSVAAGDGGDSGTANGRGGNGGSVSALNVYGDIGRRTGSNFGLDGMGGVFAGAGGLTAGPDAKLNGKAGNVTNITAAAISSIVAGRPTAVAPENFQLVSVVDRVYLRGLAAPEVNANGGFTNFATANLVGGVAANPSADGANVFKIDDLGSAEPISSNPYPWQLGTTKPIDGLVAATTLTNNRNFRPQAWLAPAPATVSPSGWALVDYRNDFSFNPLTGTSS
jgi:hypothetical protein